MPVLILIVLVIVAVVVIAVRNGRPTGQGTTTGLWCLASGLIAAAGLAMIGQATFGWVPSFDPPEWLRIVTFWMLPVGVIAAAGLGALSLRQASGRTLALPGLTLGALSAAGFFALIASVEY